MKFIIKVLLYIGIVSFVFYSIHKNIINNEKEKFKKILKGKDKEIDSLKYLINCYIDSIKGGGKAIKRDTVFLWDTVYKKVDTVFVSVYKDSFIQIKHYYDLKERDSFEYKTKPILLNLELVNKKDTILVNYKVRPSFIKLNLGKVKVKKYGAKLYIDTYLDVIPPNLMLSLGTSKIQVFGGYDIYCKQFKIGLRYRIYRLKVF